MKHFCVLFAVFVLFAFSLNAQSINLSSQSSDLNTCGAADTFQVVITNTSAQTLDSIRLIVNFHDGVSYQGGSLNGLGYGERDVSNPDSVTFAANGIAPFSSDTLVFTAAADCRSIDSSAVNNSLQINYLQGSDAAISAPYDILVPALSVQSITPPSFTGPLGATFSRCISVINGGFGSVNGFTVVIERDPVTLNYANFVLSANSSVLTPTISGDSIIFQITTAEIQALGNLDTLFEQNENIEICFDITLDDCIDLGSLISTYWGCKGVICERQASSANIVVPTLVPNIVATDFFTENRCYGDNTPSIIRMVIENNGTGPARDVVVSVWQGGSAGPINGYISRLDTSNVRVVDSAGNPVGHTLFDITNGPNTGVYSCLGPAPVRSLRVLIPFLRPGERDTITVEQYSCCKTWCAVSPSNRHRTTFKVDYNDQCFTNTYQRPVNTIGTDNYGRVVTLTPNGPVDVPQGDTVQYCLEHASFRLNRVNPGAYYYVDIITPPGLQVVTGPGCFYYEDPQGDLWNSSSFNVMGDTVRVFFDMPQPGNFGLEKSQFKYKLTTDCTLGACISGPKTVEINMRQVADTSCACVSVIGCYSYVVNAHCGICPATCQDGGMLFLGFDAQRLNYGLPDNDNDGLPDGSGTIDMNLVRTQHLMFNDTLITRFRGAVDTTSANPFWVDGFARSTITRGANLTPIAYSVRIVDASTNTAYNCTLGAPTITANGVHRTYTYALDTAVLAGCVPPGFVYEVNDSVEVTALYQVTTNPGNFLQAQTIKNEFAMQTPGGGLIAGCDNYSGNWVLVGYFFLNSGFNRFSTIGCLPVAVSENYYLSIGNAGSNYAGGNMFRYEFRHWAIPLQGRVVMPPGYSFIDASIRHFRTVGNQQYTIQSINPFNPTNISGDTVYFDLASMFVGNGGTMPLGDDGFLGSLRLRLQPSCGTPTEVYSAVRYLYDFAPVPQLTGPGSYTTIRTSRDSIFYRGHSLAIYPALPNAPGIGSTVFWTFTVENNSNTAPVDSTWFAFNSPTGFVVPVTVTEILTNTVITDVNGIYKFGVLPPDSGRTFRVEANYANCQVDSLQILSGGDCNTYPVNLAAYGCTPATSWLYIEPQPSDLQANLTVEPGPHDICDSLLVEFEVVSSQLANIRDILVQGRMPLSGGLTFAPGSAEMLYPSAGTFASIPDPVIAGNTFSWDINAINATIAANDLPGTVLADSNSFVIRFYLNTNCNMISGDRIRFRVEGERSCGDALPPSILISDPININGAVQGYQTQIGALAVQNSACPMNQTATIEIVNTGIGSTVAGDSIFANFGPGYTYVGNFSGQVNAPTNTAPTVQSGPGGIRLGWETPPGVVAGDTIRFTFDFEVGDAVDCGPAQLNVQTVTNQILFCARSMTNCNAATLTGSFALNLNIQRPDLSFSGFNSTIQPIGGGFDYIYGGTIVNNGIDILGGTTTNVDFYCDSDQSGGYSPGDTPLGTYSTTNGITTALPHPFSGNFFIPLGACSDTNMIYALIVPNSAGGYCICDTALGNSNVILPVEWLTLQGEALDAGNELRWNVRLLPQHDHFLVERQRGAGWEVISPRITGRQVRHDWLDGSPEAVEVYRIRATDQNGQRSYSPSVEIVREDALSGIRVYPNPATQSVMLEARPGTQFRIFNALGQSMLNGEIQSNEALEVPVSQLTKGVYLIEFRTGNQQQTVRLVVE